MPAAVSRLIQIAAQLRQLPDSLDFDSRLNVEGVAGDLLLEAIELGAFSGPEHVDLLNRIRRAKLCSADYRQQVFYEFVGEGFRGDRLQPYGLLADAIEAKGAKHSGSGRRNRRRRKSDPKAAEKRKKRDARQAMEKAIFADWANGQWVDYGDYVRWKNVNLPAGWSKLNRHQVTRAVENAKRRARYRKK